MEPLKNIYNQLLVERIGQAFLEEFPEFNKEEYEIFIFQEDWEDLALKERMRRITQALYATLPKDYVYSLSLIKKVAPEFRGLGGIVFPDYVEQYGLDYWEESIAALEYLTEFSTSEFAIRPFLKKDQDKTLERMNKWVSSSNEHVRRLASEGCRPRLPWGMSVPSLKKDPLPVLPILNKLKEDDSLYVRKSVANNLNDISKTHPEVVIDIAKSWFGDNAKTNWIVKHACRTLLKKGDARVLEIFAYSDSHEIKVVGLHGEATEISIGESINFSFELYSPITKKVRIEYGIDYVKANGTRSRKVFHLSETEIKKEERKVYRKTHSFKDLTTRRHYPGEHVLSIIINGSVKATLIMVIK